jgi:L-2,4-diaminobutyric acid acetyltransferase
MLPTYLVDSISFRHPGPRDAAKIWGLVKDREAGPSDHAFAYLRLCSEFSETGAVAVAEGRIVGFALGERPPARPNTFRIRRFGIARSQPGFGLGLALLDWIVEDTRERGVRYLEATLPMQEDASWGVFATYAQIAGVDIDEAPRTDSRFNESSEDPHREGVPLRIGPLDQPG